MLLNAARACRATALVVFGALAGPTRLPAQCPDGSPPPCGAVEAATTRRVDPALDERTWLVLPFDNLTRVPELDIVRDASVTLMYLEMSRWTDVRVIDDTRVADLVRGIPAGDRIGQELGFSLARRVGAGRLVLGTLLREGPRTGVIAGVFDVRSGRRLRSVRESLVGTDSLSVAFGRLAQGVLALPPLEGGAAGASGTSSTEAMRAYAAGVQAFQRWRTDSATLWLRRAVELDSTFAIAHFRLSLVLGAQGFFPQAARHRDAAARHSMRLAPRERLILSRARATSRTEVCAIASEMLRTDSSDAESWLAAGDCEASARVLVDPTGRARFETGWWRRFKAYERALASDTASLPSIASILGVLMPGGAIRTGCGESLPGPCRFEATYQAVARLDGDSVAETPEPWLPNRGSDPRRTMEAYRARRALLERGRDLATRFLASYPRQILVHATLATILLGLGDLAGAERELDAASEASQLLVNRRTYYRDRIELELRRERPDAARALLDSMFLDSTAQAQPQVATTFGRFSLDQTGASPLARAARTSYVALFSGAVPPSADSVVRHYAEAFAAQVSASRQEWTRRQLLEIGTVLIFPYTRTGPALDTTSGIPMVRFDAYVARGDTGRARAVLAELDADLAAYAPDWFDGNILFAAEAHLLLGDTATALERMRAFGRQWQGYRQNINFLLNASGVISSTQRLYGRAWLLYGDLAMARGTPEEARRAYRMVAGLWEGGEPPVQPLVARARAALARLVN